MGLIIIICLYLVIGLSYGMYLIIKGNGTWKELPVNTLFGPPWIVFVIIKTKKRGGLLN